MKSAGFLFLFWLGLLIPMKAQITVTNTVFPAVGDTLTYAVDTQPNGIVMTPPGGSQQWDFSGLQASFTFEQTFRDPSLGEDSGAFPSATMLLNQTTAPNIDQYLIASAQNVSVLGFSGPDPGISGIDLVATYNPPIVQSRAPVNFFDINQTSTGILLPFSPALLPGVNQLPISPPDSMRFRIAINRLDVVDGWGTLSIPGGTFDVLRQKSTEYRETRLDAKIPPLGWLDVTDVVLQTLRLDALGVDTTVTFQFLNDQSKEAIAVCTTDNSQLRVVRVQYKNLNVSTGLNEIERAVIELAVFPNPAEDVLHIRANNLNELNNTVLIYTILGQEVYRKTYEAASGSLEDLLDIANLEKGVYLCKILNGSGQVGQVSFVKQ